MSKSYFLVFFILFFISCSDELEFNNENFVTVQKSSVIDGLSTTRVDERLRENNQISSTVDVWNQTMLSRSAGVVLFTCEEVDELFPSYGGTGSISLVGASSFMSADHVLWPDPHECFGGDPEHVNITYAILLGVDRGEISGSTYGVVDSNPMYNWLLQNRLYSLSIRDNLISNTTERQDLFNLRLFELFNPSDYLLKRLAGDDRPSSFSSDRDIAFITPKHSIVREHIKTGPHDVYIEPHVLFDKIRLPIYSNEPFPIELEKEPLTGHHVHFDSDPFIVGGFPLLFDSLDFIENTDWFNIDDPEIFAQRFFANLITDGIQFSSEYVPCANFDEDDQIYDMPFYEKCIYTTLDARRGSSGGSIYYKPYNQSPTSVVAGLYQGGGTCPLPEFPGYDPNFDSSCMTKTYTWGELDNFFGVTNDDPNFDYYSTTISHFDEQVLSEVPSDDEPETFIGKPSFSDTEGDCIGSLCSNTLDGDLFLYNCPRTEDDFPGVVVGLAGAPYPRDFNNFEDPSEFDPDQSNIEGLGSFYLICRNWGDKEVAWTKEWSRLRLKGSYKTDDGHEGNGVTNGNLMDALQHKSIVFRDKNGTDQIVRKPFGMKTCPTPLVLKGFKYREGDNDQVLSIDSLICQSLTHEIDDVIINLADDPLEFRQLLGKTNDISSGDNVETVVCTHPDAVLSGLWMWVDNIDSNIGARESGFKPQCTRSFKAQ